MKVSLITVAYNSEKYILDCVHSVNNQSYKNIEHICIDGSSSDKTVDLFKQNTTRENQLISEPDQGIYDAMNKGIKHASGDIIGILNSDDFYYDQSIIELIVQEFEKNNCDAVYGNLVFVDAKRTDKIIRTWKSSAFKSGGFKNGWHPPHPTLFLKKEVYEKYGHFDISLNVSADFELMLRLFERFKINSSYINKTIVKMRYGGESTGSIKKIFEGNSNILKAFKKNGVEASHFYLLKRLIPKLKQFISN